MASCDARYRTKRNEHTTRSAFAMRRVIVHHESTDGARPAARRAFPGRLARVPAASGLLDVNAKRCRSRRGGVAPPPPACKHPPTERFLDQIAARPAGPCRKETPDAME